VLGDETLQQHLGHGAILALVAFVEGLCVLRRGRKAAGTSTGQELVSDQPRANDSGGKREPDGPCSGGG